MDFTLTSDQQDAAELARRVLADRCSQPRLREVEARGERFDRGLWEELGDAGLLGLALPEGYGGAGLGLLELCSVLVETGRTVAPLPLAWHGPTSMAVAAFGTDDQKQWLLQAAAGGRNVLSPALSEDRADVPARPTTTAERDGAGWRLTGAKTVVPSGTVADVFVVPADTPHGVTVFLVRPGDGGVDVLPQVLSDGDVAARL